jgi:hypothetical protein
MKLTGQMLAKALDAICDRDCWGDIEPYWFKAVANGIDEEDSEAEFHRDTKKLLDEVAKNLNTEMGLTE